MTRLAILALFISQSTFFAADAAPASGVPRIDPDYTAEVTPWWDKHPMNPRSAQHLKTIRSPQPVVSLKSGESIDDAIAKLPPEGGTIRLAAGTYAGFKIIGRSHVHVLGPDEGEANINGHSYVAVCPEAMDYVKFDAVVSHFDKQKFKDKRVWDLYRNPTSDFYFKNLVFDGEGKTAVDFPSAGIAGPGGVLGFKGIRDAIVENCTFRNFVPGQGNLQHCGQAWGHYGLTNVWFRGCRFLGTSHYAVYLDGAHGSGLVGCTIDCKGCKSGGLLFLANHDFTDDRNENGKIDADEEKCAKFLVLAGNTFEGNISAPIRLTGQNCLISGNSAKGRMLELVGVYPTGEIAHRTWGAGELKIRVVENVVGTCDRAILNIFAVDRDKLKVLQDAPADGQYTVDRNAAEKAKQQVLFSSLRP